MVLGWLWHGMRACAWRGKAVTRWQCRTEAALPPTALHPAPPTCCMTKERRTSIPLCPIPQRASGSGQAGCRTALQSPCCHKAPQSPLPLQHPPAQFLLQARGQVPSQPPAASAPTHLFVHGALLHLGAVALGGGGLLPETSPAAGPVG